MLSRPTSLQITSLAATSLSKKASLAPHPSFRVKRSSAMCIVYYCPKHGRIVRRCNTRQGIIFRNCPPIRSDFHYVPCLGSDCPFKRKRWQRLCRKIRGKVALLKRMYHNRNRDTCQDKSSLPQNESSSEALTSPQVQSAMSSDQDDQVDSLPSFASSFRVSQRPQSDELHGIKDDLHSHQTKTLIV